MGLWQSLPAPTLSVQSGIANTGTFAARGNPAGGMAFAYSKLNIQENEL
jgi:hypothetical protein